MKGNAFIERIKIRFPNLEPKVTNFESGAYMIDLKINDCLYCVEYFPNEGTFGLSKARQVSPFFEGAEELFDAAPAVEARISELARET